MSEKYADLREVQIEHAEMVHDEYAIPEDWKFAVKDEAEVKAGDVLATKDEATIIAQHGGTCGGGEEGPQGHRLL